MRTGRDGRLWNEGLGGGEGGVLYLSDSEGKHIFRSHPGERGLELELERPSSAPTSPGACLAF